MRDKSEDVGHLRAGEKLRIEKGGLADTVQGTALPAASADATADAAKTQSPNPKAQVKDEEENEEVRIPNAGADENETLGPVISPHPGLLRRAFVATSVGPMVGTDCCAMSGAVNAVLVGTMPGL
jgi:hypothetical protein